MSADIFLVTCEIEKFIALPAERYKEIYTPRPVIRLIITKIMKKAVAYMIVILVLMCR